MLTLAITTTTKLASLSLHSEDKVLGEIRIEVSKTHSTTIIDQVDSLLSWTGKKLDDIKNVLVSIGPGSFTGVRITIAVVKGLFFGKDVNFFNVNELEALAYQSYFCCENEINENDKIYALISAGKEKIYYAKYNVKEKNNLERIGDYLVGKIDDVIQEVLETQNEKNIYFIGDTVINFKDRIQKKLENKVKFVEENSLKINSATFYKMFKLDKLESVDIFNLKPDYLEKTQAEREKSNGIKKNI